MATIPQSLYQVGELLRTQDNRGTDQPLFIVQQKTRIYGLRDDYAESFTWIDMEDCEEVDAETVAGLEELHSMGKSIDDPGIYRVGYRDDWQYVTACFTEKGCQDYINANRHNHSGELRIYADGSFRNREFQDIRSFLMSLPSQPPAHGHRQDYYLMSNARRLVAPSYKRQENWVLAKELFATGSTSAKQLCQDAGIDPYGLTVDRPTQPSPTEKD